MVSQELKNVVSDAHFKNYGTYSKLYNILEVCEEEKLPNRKISKLDQRKQDTAIKDD